MHMCWCTSDLFELSRYAVMARSIKVSAIPVYDSGADRSNRGAGPAAGVVFGIVGPKVTADSERRVCRKNEKNKPMLFVREHGTAGPLLITLHGGPGAPGGMLPVARRLADRYHVIE